MKFNEMIIATSLCFLVSGCSATRTHESTGQYIDNSALTAKVKASLLADNDVKSFAITVKSYKGNVELSGFVDNEYQRSKAIRIAHQVPGVVSVKNGLVLK